MAVFRSAKVPIPSWLVEYPGVNDRIFEVIVHLCMLCYPRIYGEATTAMLANQLQCRVDSLAPALREIERLGLFRRIRVNPVPLWVMNTEAMVGGVVAPDWQPSQDIIEMVEAHNAIRAKHQKARSELRSANSQGVMMAVRNIDMKPFGRLCHFPRFKEYVRLPKVLFYKSFLQKSKARDLSGARRLFLRILARAKGFRTYEFVILDLAAELGVHRDTLADWIKLLVKGGVMTRRYISAPTDKPYIAAVLDPKAGKYKPVRKIERLPNRLQGVEVTIPQNKRERNGPGIISGKFPCHVVHDAVRREKP